MRAPRRVSEPWAAAGRAPCPPPRADQCSCGNPPPPAGRCRSAAGRVAPGLCSWMWGACKVLFLREQEMAGFNSSSRKCVFCSLGFFTSANRAARPEPLALPRPAALGQVPRECGGEGPREWGRREGTASKRATPQAGPRSVPRGGSDTRAHGRGRRALCPVGPKQTAVGARSTGIPGVNGDRGGETQAGAQRQSATQPHEGGRRPSRREGDEDALGRKTLRLPQTRDTVTLIPDCLLFSPESRCLLPRHLCQQLFGAQ